MFYGDFSFLYLLKLRAQVNERHGCEATRNQVCVSTALARRWTLRYTLCGGRRKGKVRWREAGVARWVSQPEPESAEWQIKCQLTERTLAPNSLAPSTTQVVFVSHSNTPSRANTHTSATCGLNWWLLSALKRLICKKNNSIWVWQTFLLTHSDSIINRKTATQITLFLFFIFKIVRI